LDNFLAEPGFGLGLGELPEPAFDAPALVDLVDDLRAIGIGKDAFGSRALHSSPSPFSPLERPWVFL
jgi:hypothetical protein